MSDFEKVMEHIRGLEPGKEEISDACARVIASWWSAGGETLSMSFVSTGAIVDTASNVWWMCGGEHYNDSHLTDDDKLCLDYLATYLQVREGKGPVEGWSDLWL